MDQVALRILFQDNEFLVKVGRMKLEDEPKILARPDDAQ